MRAAGTGKIRSIVDPYTLILADGKTVRLSGIDLPDHDPFEPGEMAARALQVLRDKFEGKSVTLYQTKDAKTGRINRMGHELAHIELIDGKLWAQGLLLAEGLARVRTSARNPEMAGQMLALEQEARAGEAGIWGLTGFPVLEAGTAGDHAGGFQIVEGKVRSVAIVRNTIYLNFGQDWRSDFTIGIPAAGRRAFTKAGIDPLQWAGTDIRGRGWLRSWNGAYMEVDHPQAIEFVESSKLSP